MASKTKVVVPPPANVEELAHTAGQPVKGKAIIEIIGPRVILKKVKLEDAERLCPPMARLVKKTFFGTQVHYLGHYEQGALIPVQRDRLANRWGGLVDDEGIAVGPPILTASQLHIKLQQEPLKRLMRSPKSLLEKLQTGLYVALASGGGLFVWVLLSRIMEQPTP